MAQSNADSFIEHDIAIEHFTDRHDAARLFCDYLHADPPHEQVLFFHGDGGNGKSLLLRYLRENHCRLLTPQDWKRIKALPADDDDFDRMLAEATSLGAVPVAQIDFGMQPQGNDRPQEVVYGLLMLRRQLAAFDLHFPLFDYAILWRLHKNGQLTKEHMLSLLPEAEMNFLTVLSDVIAAHPYAALAKAAFDVFSKKIGQDYTFARYARHLNAEEIEKIQRADPNGTLLDLLPQLFGQDLNHAMRRGGNGDKKAPERVALFFDTHEAFWGSQRQYQHNAATHDEWLRRLLLELDPTLGIVVVVAGRDRPRWPQAARCNLPTEGKRSLRLFLVDHLSAAHARQYLDKVRATVPMDDALCASIVAYASARPNEVHPMHLGLCVDVVRAARASGRHITAREFAGAPEFESRNQELIDRLLRYVDADTSTAVRALSVCRGFDRAIFKVLGADDDISYVTSKATFEHLIGFSFVRAVTLDGAARYRIHDTLRRLLRDRDPALTQRAHEVMEAYYRRLAEADPRAIAGAIYHTNRLDAERGAKEWEETFDNALSYSRHDLCNALLAVREELHLPGDIRRGGIAQSVGNYFARISRHAAAEQEYRLSLAAYDEVLAQQPNDVKAHNNKGNTLQILGKLQAQLTRHEQAQESYRLSIQAFEAALQLAPDYAYAHNNKGAALQSLGDLQAQLTRYEQAQDSYRLSIQAFDAALQLTPDEVYAHNNKGITLQSLGELQAQLTRYEQAEGSYASSIQAYDAALLLTPDYTYAHNNKGLTLQKLGDLQAQLARYKQAEESYTRSIQSCDAALQLAPDYVIAHNNKGLTLQRLGDLQAQLTRHEQAQESYARSIQSCDTALQLAPDYAYAHHNKGLALRGLGSLRLQAEQHEAAASYWRQALAEFDEALRIAPRDGEMIEDRAEVQALLDGLN